MSAVEVRTQAELDKALANLKDGDWVVCLGGSRYKPLQAWGSSHVVASESSHVEARGSSHVVAWGSSHVVASESSHVEASESSHVEAWESSHVVARGSSHVVARGSSHVEAWESSHVEARGSSHVEASKFVSVHEMPSHRKTISGGVVIEVPDVSTMTPAEWCDYYGVAVSRGFATLFKAVDDDLSTSHARRVEITYTPGAKVKAPDWEARPECGNGLHCSPSPAMAASYNDGASRYVAVKAKLADLVIIGDKAKVPALTVLYECDRSGGRLAVVS